MVKDKIETVLGKIAPGELQQTLTHEHVSLNFLKHLVPTSDSCQNMVNCEFTMQNLNWIRHNPYSCKPNVLLSNKTEAVVEDLKLYKKAGGSTIVENTSLGLSRDVMKMKAIAEQTGVNIVCGTGYYVEKQLTDEMKALSVEQMTEKIVSEINDGIDNTNIKPGIIGEIGCSWPLTEVEKRSLRASAIAQAQTLTPVMIHPGRHPTAPDEILRVFQEQGGDAKHTVMAHLDRTLLENADILEFAKCGTFLEYDLFGIETSYYQFAPEIDFPSDAQRIDRVGLLISEGYDERVLFAHDIHTPHRLTRYGGHGYTHIFDQVVPKMLRKGISKEAIDKILISNPKSWLTYA
ncbi:phosphotriesterase-related protein-like [Dendronephthya gigantea]|uniref:phosphotriesterase-related protein-like n=1 Tax=Dendronephthya gigantea TaxID=151771 RepID=UPI00106AD66D|nr:phosphotriesterase-related protein-like [Dendronephthya gigantea]